MKRNVEWPRQPAPPVPQHRAATAQPTSDNQGDHAIAVTKRVRHGVLENGGLDDTQTH